MAPLPQKIRDARAFLRRRNLTPPVSPRTFAQSADEMQKSFAELLRFIMRLKQGNQNQEAQRQEEIRAASGVTE